MLLVDPEYSNLSTDEGILIAHRLECAAGDMLAYAMTVATPGESVVVIWDEDAPWFSVWEAVLRSLFAAVKLHQHGPEPRHTITIHAREYFASGPLDPMLAASIRGMPSDAFAVAWMARDFAITTCARVRASWVSGAN
jgi:hypothetical protein